MRAMDAGKVAEGGFLDPWKRQSQAVSLHGLQFEHAGVQGKTCFVLPLQKRARKRSLIIANTVPSLLPSAVHLLQ
jgi:hypothetical protein